jgi:hypothetical protein
VLKNITGSVNPQVVQSGGTIQSDVTATCWMFRATPATAAASFTVSTLNHFGAAQGTFGAGSIVTNQMGFHAESSLVGATSNYGFYSNISAGTTRTITNVERASNVVTITTSAAHGYLAGQSVTVTATTNTSVNGTFTIASAPTTTTFTYAQTAADLSSTVETGSTVVVGRWNFYGNGSAPNYFGGNVNIGGTETYPAGSLTAPRFQITGTTGNATTTSIVGWGTSSSIFLSRSAGSSIGTRAAVADATVLGQVVFHGDDGTAFVPAAQIQTVVDGAPGTNDMPGRLVFSTTEDGASSLTERMRIDNAGNIVCNTAAIATTATNGFLYIPTCAGTPTGVPKSYTGRVPIVVDSTNNILYMYVNGAWRNISAVGSGFW